MKTFNSLGELIAHLEKIPEHMYITFNIDNKMGQACVMGHINEALHGNKLYGNIDFYQSPSFNLLAEFGIKGIDLVRANNANEENPKKGALDFLKSKLPHSYKIMIRGTDQSVFTNRIPSDNLELATEAGQAKLKELKLSSINHEVKTSLFTVS